MDDVANSNHLGSLWSGTGAAVHYILGLGPERVREIRMRIGQLKAQLKGEPETSAPQLAPELDRFLELYAQRPIRDNSGGMKSVGMFAVWSLLWEMQPDHVIESGIWKGQSTWLIEQSLPNASVTSLDIILGLREYVSTRSKYLERDFLSLSAADLGIRSGKCLAFFDDHQDALPRILRCAELGIRTLIFDDNYPEFLGQRHLSVTAVSRERNANGSYRFPNEKAQLETLVESIRVFPPLFDFDGLITGEQSRIQEKSWLGPFDPLRHGRWSEYWHDMSSYRWTTLVRLR